MVEFRDYLANLKIEHTGVINEMPRIFTLDVNSKYIDEYLIEPIKKSIINNRCEYIKQLSNGLHLLCISKMFNKIYFLSNEEQVVAGTMINVDNSTTDSFYQFKITKKIDAELKGVLVDLYREISKDLNNYVYSDNLQSISSSTIWRKMFANPEKYKIKDIKILKNKKEVKTTSYTELDI